MLKLLKERLARAPVVATQPLHRRKVGALDGDDRMPGDLDALVGAHVAHVRAAVAAPVVRGADLRDPRRREGVVEGEERRRGDRRNGGHGAKAVGRERHLDRHRDRLDTRGWDGSARERHRRRDEGRAAHAEVAKAHVQPQSGRCKVEPVHSHSRRRQVRAVRGRDARDDGRELRVVVRIVGGRAPEAHAVGARRDRGGARARRHGRSTPDLGDRDECGRGRHWRTQQALEAAGAQIGAIGLPLNPALILVAIRALARDGDCIRQRRKEAAQRRAGGRKIGAGKRQQFAVLPVGAAKGAREGFDRRRRAGVVEGEVGRARRPCGAVEGE